MTTAGVRTILGGLLVAGLAASASSQVPATPSATDKVSIYRLGAQHEQHRHRRQPDDPDQHRRLVEPVAAATPDHTFLEKKQDGLLRELEKQPELGRFNFPGYMGPDPNNIMRLGTDIRYAMSHPGEDGGRRIVIITPRVIGFQEARNQPRTVDYPFTLFEMRFDKAGKGEGRMAYATQIGFDKKKNTVELENYSSEPVRLNNLVLTVKK